MTTADVVESALRIVAAVAPGVIGALAGGRTDEEAIAEARRLVDGLPEADDAWAADLRRRERGE